MLPPTAERAAAVRGGVAALLAGVVLWMGPVQTAAGEPDPVLRALLLEAASSSDSFGDRFEAEVWLTDMSRRLTRQVPDAEERLYMLRHVHYEAARADLPPELVLAVIDVESNFDRYAISVAGALGLMQVMPFWLKEIGRPDDNLFHIRTNLRMGCTILRYYLDMERGDLVKALARYNGSRGQRWYSDRVLDRLRTRWFQG
jgi:soluble lytic murein transglycosylase-like protein